MRYLAYMLVVCSLLLGCKEASDTTKKTAAATVEHAVKESKLAQLILTPKASERLGIKTARIQRQTLKSSRTLGGYLVIPPGKTTVISAPAAGSLLASMDTPMPAAGSNLEKGHPLFQLLVLPTDGDLMSAKHQIAEQKVLLNVAKSKAKRAKKLLDANLGTQELYDESLAEVAREELALKVAKNRSSILSKSGQPTETGAFTTLRINAPASGVIQKVFVMPGQTVASGTPLVQFSALNTLWVKVAIYAGDLETFNLQQAVTVSRLGHTKSYVHPVSIISAPPSADPTTASIDLFFELQNKNGHFRPGERVNVNLPLQHDAENLTLPYSAVVYDIHGGTWIYVNPAPNRYHRQRIELKDVIDDIAIVRRGPPEQTAVVIAGAAELFGTEFGGGK